MKKIKRKKLFLNFSKGKSELPLLVSIIVLGVITAGGLLISYNPGLYPTQLINGNQKCCDSGDGSACVPSTTQTFNYIDLQGKSIPYGLLKSNITLVEGGNHLQLIGQKINEDPILKNISDGFLNGANEHECGEGMNDQVWVANGKGKDGTECYPIPNDELMYVCKKNCPATVSSCTIEGSGGVSTCYGDKTSIYDVYFRLSDIPNPGVPDAIANCGNYALIKNINPAPIINTVQQTIVPANPYDEHKTLQIHTFGLATPAPNTGSSSWLSPYCKPAIYLYPPKKEAIYVGISPKGKMKQTIPLYPKNGWHVIANPQGDITYNNISYDYLFYEAIIPDSLIPEQNTGYVVAYAKLADLFATLLPKLGLNQKEQQQFSHYWLEALPKNPYYLISLVPDETLQNISPLTIIPQPDTLIRVDVQFKPLDKHLDIAPPILSQVKRTGFTVVEWGGLFKQDKDHPFTCLM